MSDDVPNLNSWLIFGEPTAIVPNIFFPPADQDCSTSEGWPEAHTWLCKCTAGCNQLPGQLHNELLQTPCKGGTLRVSLFRSLKNQVLIRLEFPEEPTPQPLLRVDVSPSFNLLREEWEREMAISPKSSALTEDFANRVFETIPFGCLIPLPPPEFTDITAWCENHIVSKGYPISHLKDYDWSEVSCPLGERRLLVSYTPASDPPLLEQWIAWVPSSCRQLSTNHCVRASRHLRTYRLWSRFRLRLRTS